nr:hypothetical protein CFP56_76563 [Quercus suber]
MDQLAKAKEKVEELKEALKVKKNLIIQKDEEVQDTLLRTDEKCEKHHSHKANFTNLDFEAVDIEILADEANEKEGETIPETTKVVEEKGVVTRGANDEAHTEVDRIKETINAP